MREPVEVDWPNKLSVNTASSSFSFHETKVSFCTPVILSVTGRSTVFLSTTDHVM